MMKRIFWKSFFQTQLKNGFLFFVFLLPSFCMGGEAAIWEEDEGGQWLLDRSASRVSFSVAFLVFSKVTGLVNEFDSSLRMEKQGIDSALINIVAQAQSIDTGNASRNEEIHSKEFFDASHHPYIYFKIRNPKKKKNNIYQVEAFVTIKGNTQKALFSMKCFDCFNGGAKDPSRVKLKIYGTLNRLDFGMKLNPLLETGGVFLSKDIDVDCEMEFRLERGSIFSYKPSVIPKKFFEFVN